MYSEIARARTVEPLEALGIDPVVGRLPAVDSHSGCGPKPMVSRSIYKVAEGLAGVQALFTSALEYHVRVPDQRDAALEP